MSFALPGPDDYDELLKRLDPSTDVFESPPVTVRQFVMLEEYGNQAEFAWPTVVDELAGIFGDDAEHFQNQEAVLCWAIGAGKSFLVSMAFAYMVYWVLNLKDPQRYFGLAPGSTIVWLNQSINELQAKRVVFHEVKQRIMSCPWFQDHVCLPDPNIRSELRFPKDVVVFPGNSSLTYPAGYNLLGGVLDEAAWFIELMAQADIDRGREEPAEGIYLSMRRRIRSRFGGRGLLLIISNPRHAEDFIERQYEFATIGAPERNVPPPERVYASRKALWDTKPGPQRDDQTGRWQPWHFVRFAQEKPRPDGTMEVISEMRVPDVFLPDFQANPEKAKRDLAAIAARTGMGFFWDPDVVYRPREALGLPGYNPARQHPFNEHYQLEPWVQWKETNTDAVCHAHIDLGLTRDACGLAVGHVSGDTMIAGEKKPVIVIDAMLEISVPEGMEVDFQEVRNLVYVLRDRGFPIKYATFDGWQSVDGIQQFRKRGIESEVLSVDFDMAAYDTFKEAVHEGRADYYRYRPLYDCVKSLIIVRGKKVDHVRTGKKDVSDAVAGVCQTLTERYMLVQPPAAARVPSAVVAVASRRRGIERSPY